MKTKLLLLFALISSLSYAQTFDWSSVSFNGTNYVRQTVAGIQAECTNSSNTVEVLNGGGFAGSNGNIITSTATVAFINVAFSAPIDVQSVFAFDGNGVPGTWTFTPTGGTNANVVQSIASTTGSNVNVNWTNVTSFTITSSSGMARFSIDDIVFTIPTCADINIPDANFKSYLLGNTAINTNGDNEIQCGEATAYTGIINCSYLSISDLTGIQAFINITELYAQYNSITSIDVSTNTALVRLNCSNNNSLTNLNVSGATALEFLWCESSSSLTSLDVSGATSLEHLYSYNGALTSINISGATALETLSIYNNSITSIDVSANTALRYLTCNNNSLTSLDTSTNTDLRELFCQNNSLTSLNVANGNNTIVTDFSAVNNPGLACVTVDDVVYSDSNWVNIDMQTSFNTSCSTLSLDDFELYRNEIKLYPNPSTSVLNIKMKNNLKQATIYSVLGTKILETASKNITTSNLKNGFYLIVIEDETGRLSTKQFIKQ